MKKILFITWDGPSSSYLEGLFCPIFEQIARRLTVEFHLFQFIWGDLNKIAEQKERLEEKGFIYNYIEIKRKPFMVLGTIFAICKGIAVLKKYILNNKIDIIIPRATMPTIIVNRLVKKAKNVKILFDADGLPIDERVDFANLNKKSLLYNLLKREETRMLKCADAVIVRSLRAAKIHLSTIGNQYERKFFKVANGRDEKLFSCRINNSQRVLARSKLGIDAAATVFVYCGALGPQYCWNDMLSIFSSYLSLKNNSKFIILTGNFSYLNNRIPFELESKVIVKEVPYYEVPIILSICDIAFAIRQPSYSMQGVAPIKLAEYLLMGLPTIASAGIGDTEEMLQDIRFCYLYRNDENDISDVVSWCVKTMKTGTNKDEVHQFAVDNFSLGKSALDYIQAIDFIKK